MKPENCQGRECLHYLVERESCWEGCGHEEYDIEIDACPGWVSLADARVYDPERHDRERE